MRVTLKDLNEDATLVDAATNRVVLFERDGEELRFVAKDVPSCGYKTFRFVPPGVGFPKWRPLMTAADGVLENYFYRVRFDKTTGAITSIFDRLLNVELVDQAAPHKFNEYLYERYETPDVKNPSKWYRVQSATLNGSAGPVSAKMTVRASAVGAEKIERSVILYNGLKRIDFVLDLVKSPSGRDGRDREGDVRHKESVYVALPFEIADFKFHHEVPGCVEEPVKDLFQGACTAYYSVRHFSDVSNQSYGVTVSAPESSLVEYGRPRSCPNPICRLIAGDPVGSYEMQMTPPANSRMYLYLMNNMFDTNIPLSQAGPARFTWSLRSHAGDWREGRADQFGWETMNPLVATVVAGKRTGGLTEPAASFLTVDQPNVVCTTIKPAEANGRGIVLRFVETQGKPTTSSFRATFFGTPAAAIETSLLEDDRGPLAIGPGGEVAFAIEPFGVKTIRLLSQPNMLPSPPQVAAEPLSDMEVALKWNAPDVSSEKIGYYRIYRGTKPDFQPGLLNLVARVGGTAAVDRPTLHFGGWINDRVEPETTYYYRVSAIDRWNNESPASAAVKATTLKSSEKNALPNRVERLSAILISPLGQHDHVNLLFRTNCESDVVRYEIHRCGTPGFVPGEKTRIGEVDANAIIKGSTAYGHTPIDRRLREFDHIMYQDNTVEAFSEYYYRVRAVDAVGQKGPFSEEAAVTTTGREPQISLGRKITAQSVYSPEYGRVLAIDGNPDPFHAWISKPYGGGTKEKPLDVWWQIESPGKTWRIKGVRIIGDHREIIPLQKNLRVELCQAGVWKTVAEVHDATQKDILATWPQPLETSGIRIVGARRRSSSIGASRGGWHRADLRVALGAAQPARSFAGVFLRTEVADAPSGVDALRAARDESCEMKTPGAIAPSNDANLENIRGAYPNLLASARGRAIAFFSFYFIDGVLIGFMGIFLAMRMRAQNVRVDDIAMFVAAVYLPASWKWLFGPLVDLCYSERLGRRRGWILGTEALMIVVLLTAMRIDFVKQFPALFTIAMLLVNLFAALQRIAVNALACNVLTDAERGTANGM